MPTPATIVSITGVLNDGTVGGFAQAMQNIRLPQSTDVAVRLTVKNPAGQPVSLVGATVVLTVRVGQTDTNPAISKLANMATGGFINAANGTVEFDLSATLLSLSPGPYLYDVTVALASTARAQLVPLSTFTVDPSAYHSTDTPA